MWILKCKLLKMKNSSVFSFLVLLLWLPLLCAGQSSPKSGKVTYAVELGFNPSEESKAENTIGLEYLQKSMDQAIKSVAGIKPVLQFNQEQAKFFAEEGMENDASPGLEIALLLLDLDGAHYTDLSLQKTLVEQEAFGKLYLMERPLKTSSDWVITSEKGKIGNYTVFKATTTEVVVNPKGRFESPVIAWFAPEIPFSFGPIGYGGLPGLILELEIQSRTPVRYYVRSVKFEEDTWTMEVPENRELISEEDLENMYREAGSNLRSY